MPVSGRKNRKRPTKIGHVDHKEDGARLEKDEEEESDKGRCQWPRCHFQS
jgi:hypothetical protein